MLTREALLNRDAADPLRSFRDRFDLPDGMVYLDGNSLGALPKDTAARLADVVAREWGQDLITSWNKNGWYELPLTLGNKLGRLIGAAEGQVAIADSTSINLFKVLAAAIALRPGRKVIISDSGNFPTDLYMAQGLTTFLGGVDLLVVDETEVAQSLNENVAAVFLTEVNYRSGRKHDMAALTQKIHEVGALAIWDLAHSAGAFPVHLDAAGADFAVGCGYKYLNGGPGAPAFLYIAKRHQHQAMPILSGWMGHAAPFLFDLDYRPADGMRRALAGTPAILSMRALEVGIDLMLEADLSALAAKSTALTEVFMRLVEQECPGVFGNVTPADPARRGSQVCLTHAQGYAIVQALIARKVIPDFRAPDILRFGFAPLYVGFADLWDAVAHLKAIMDSGEWKESRFAARGSVT
ncbi:kynureninase [Lacibacterium aquatile]|uniref:Kynureninase n=1 Tax=Lacibacterium aquatile TaxID=1168082 RepID=A0ABW5DP01_9PROT